MMWLFAILLVVVLGGVAAVAAGRGGMLPEPERDRVPVVLPEGRLSGVDLRRVRFPLAVRGYRMADVDALLDRLAGQLETSEDTGDRTGVGAVEGAPDEGRETGPESPSSTGPAAQRLDNETG